jgi:hypothetical protein
MWSAKIGSGLNMFEVIIAVFVWTNSESIRIVRCSLGVHH